MMLLKYVRAFALLVGSFSLSFGQADKSFIAKMNDPSVNFYTVCAEAEAYFETIDKSAKGSGWKPYQRWKVANESRFYPSGDRSQVDPYFVQHQYELFLANQEKMLYPNGWKDLGPYTIDSITGHYAAGLGRIEDFYVHPTNMNIVYQGSRSGGFWKSSDGGASWQNGGTDFLPASGVNAIGVYPTNPNEILINVQNAQNEMSHGIYRSTDGGNSWAVTLFNPGNLGFGGLGSSFRIYEIAYHPTVPDLVFIGTSRGIFRSTDNLQTWTQLYSTLEISEIAFHPTNNSIIYIYDSYYWSNTHDFIYRSTDQGISYALSGPANGNGNERNVRLATSPDCPNCVFFASDNGVWKSTDSGVNFTFQSNPGVGCGDFTVGDLDATEMIIGGIDLFMSADDGISFTQRSYWALGNTNGAGNGNQVSYNTSTDYVHADLRKAKCINGIYYVATDGFLSKSTDGGISWENIGDNIGVRENYCLGLSQSNLAVSMSGSQDNGTSILEETGWIEFYGADGMEAIVHPLNDNMMIGSLQNGGRRRTMSGGKSQDGVTPPNNGSAYWIAPLAYDPNQHMTVYDFRDTLFRSDDFGSTWVKLGAPSSFSGVIKKAEIAQNNSNIIVISSDQYIDKSTDGGLTFSSIKNNLPGFFIEDIAFDPKNDNRIVVVYGRYQNDNQKVYMTENGGASWVNITGNLANMPIRSVVIDHSPESNIYLGAEIGVYTKPLNGSNWALYNPNLPNVAIRELEINYGANVLKAATWGRGMWEYHLVNRADFPAIVRTSITSTPNSAAPKAGVDQFVTTKIHADQTPTSVFTRWSVNAPTFDNVIPMSNTVDSTWVTNSPIPDQPVGTLVYFKVFAVGNNGDTSETYKFMYEVKPFEYCVATGNAGAGNLYLSNVTSGAVNNTTGNTNYAFYSTPVITLENSLAYSLSVTANTNWQDNDYAAWIDFNGDRDFTEDELVLWSVDQGVSTVTSSFTVPALAVAGESLMRVRLSYWGSSPEPCGDQFGEVEDYAVMIENDLGVVNAMSALVAVYPNPTTGEFTVDLKGVEGETRIVVYASDGREILETAAFGSDKAIISMNVEDGVYFVHMENAEFTGVSTIVVAK